MSRVYFTSDLHLGHASIIKFAGAHGREGSNSKEHDEWIIHSWNSIVRKRDLVWVLGDVAMGGPGTKESPGIGWTNLAKVAKLNGTKKIILGNHDDMPIEAYQQYFQVVRGMGRHKGHWLSHCPIHPVELRGRKNVHGHVHHNTLDDDRYINVCVEENLKRTGTILVDWEQLGLNSYMGTGNKNMEEDDDR